MQPSGIEILTELPLTANGKVDKRALPEITPRSEAAYEDPQGEAEQALAEIWRELLGVEQVGRSDNFFELGGDSILSIQFISRAQTQGLYLTPRQVFEAQTLSALANLCEASPLAPAEQGMVRGSLPLTPIQRWFFEKHSKHPHHFNQSVLLEAQRTLQPEFLTRVLEELFRHHDSLRTRFAFADGQWRAAVAEQIQPAAGLLRVESLDGLTRAARQIKIAAVNRQMQASLDITRGPLLRAALFNGESGEKQILLIVIHHLAVDFVSWQILIHDLWQAYDQCAAGNPPRLPAKTSSFKAWADYQIQYAHDPKTEAALNYWLGVHQDEPVAAADARADSVARAQKTQSILPELETRALLREAPRAYHTQINDLLLTALAKTFYAWTGQSSLLIDLEGHGRESETLDLSRTVGWFTALFPVRLQINGEELGEQIRSIKEQLRQIPDKGVSYGALRYLNEKTAAPLSALPQPQIIFNYGGQLKTIAVQALGDEIDENAALGHSLNISAAILHERLVVTWTYSRRLYQRHAVESLAREFIETLREVISHCHAAQAGVYAPQDFPLSGLNQEELNRILPQDAHIADLYPLAPMQRFILEQTLSAPQDGVYFTQLGFEIDQGLDVPRFQQAWQRMAERHDILRAQFLWQDLPRPLQAIRYAPRLIWNEQDWRDLPPEAQTTRLQNYLAEERAAGFDLEQSPMRLALLRLEENRWQFIWHVSHLLLDGWSYPLLLRELGELYQDPDTPLPAASSYRDFIAWLNQQDPAPAERFWREALTGAEFSAAPKQIQSQRRYGEYALHLDEELSSALRAFAQRSRLTLNTLMQAAWALTLRWLRPNSSPLFDVAVSGRSAPLAGMEARVGLFIHALPLRVALLPQQSILDWLQNLMRAQSKLEAYAYASPSLPPRWSVLRFQNYPSNDSLSGALNAKNFIGVDWWSYPLNVAIIPNSKVKLSITFDERFFMQSDARRLAFKMEAILRGIARAAPNALLSALLLNEESL